MDKLNMTWFDDEQSQFIFRNRVAYSESGNERFMREIIDRYIPELQGNWYPEKEKELIAIAKGGSNVWIWGAGLRGRYVIEKLKEINIKINGIIDKDQEKTNVLGIPVFTPGGWILVV